MSGKVVAARPESDVAIVLAGPVAPVWVALDAWATVDDLRQDLSDHHPELDVDECEALVEQALRVLDDEGLLERRHR